MEDKAQKFDYIVVLDFGKIQYITPPSFALSDIIVCTIEATCDEKKNFGPQEIIEFPSVLLNTKTLKVKQQHPKINYFCFKILFSSIIYLSTNYSKRMEIEILIPKLLG